MRRIICLLAISIFIYGCSQSEKNVEKTLKLSDGKNVVVSIYENEASENEKDFVVEYQVDEETFKDEKIENDVLVIWKQIENIANMKNFEEAIIKTKYFVGIGEKSKKKKYKGFLFEAEKIENGTWKIRKVN